jgi:hypothetical protein
VDENQVVRAVLDEKKATLKVDENQVVRAVLDEKKAKLKGNFVMLNEATNNVKKTNMRNEPTKTVIKNGKILVKDVSHSNYSVDVYCIYQL